MKPRILYSAIVLPDSEHTKLLAAFGSRIPKGYEVIAHHVTIKMGELPPELKDNIGLPVQFQVMGFHLNDKVCAVQAIVPNDLRPFMKNEYPHVTLGVNKAAGGKPVMSNDLIKFDVQNDLSSDTVGTYTHTPLRLTGIIQEIT